MITKVLIPLALIILLPSAVAATDYYVDATGGNDNNDGLSPSNAWKTIAKVNSETFQPGDSILFKRGEVWREQLTVPSSGNSTHPITFGAYGNGEKPILMGSEQLTGWTDEGGNVYSTVFDSWDGYSGTIGIWETDWTGYKNYVWKGTSKDDIDGSGQVAFDDLTNTIYIRCSDDGDPSTHVIEAAKKGVNYYEDFAIWVNNKDYIVLDGLHTQYTDRSGICLEYSTHITVKNCTVEHLIRNGAIQLNNADNCMIGGAEGEGNSVSFSRTVGVYLHESDDNLISWNNITYQWEDGCGLSHSGTNCDSNIFEHNEISYPGEDGFDVDHAVNTKIRYNYIHHVGQDRYGYGVFLNGRGATEKDNHVYGNLIVDPNRHGIVIFSRNSHVYYNIIDGYGSDGDGFGIVVFPNCQTGYVYNNIIIDNLATPGGRGCLAFSEGESGLVVKNNIFARMRSSGNTVVRFYSEADVANNVLDHNIVYSKNSNDIYYVPLAPGNPFTLSEFHTRYNQSANSTNSDPLFKDFANNDFHLQSDSPCIDNGTDVGLTQDFDGNPIVGLPDIGAYEYQPADMIPPYRSNGSPTGTLPAGTTQTNLFLNTDEAATCRYSTTPGTSYSSMANTFSTTGGTSHSTLVSGLQDGQSYAYYVRCQDSAGNDNPDDFPISFSVASGLNDLVGYWTMNSEDISGDMLLDKSGNGNNGTIHGSPQITTGKVGDALYFDGVSDYMRISHHSSIDNAFVNTFTITSWIKIRGNTGENAQMILGKRSGSDGLCFGRQNSNGYLYIYKDGSGQFHTGSAVPVGEWIHVAAAFNDTDNSYSMYYSMYVNGDLWNSGTYDMDIGSNSVDLAIGRQSGISSLYYFNGTIDEVRIYNRALTSEEVLEYYNQETYHRADTNQDGCIDLQELLAFIDRWKVSSKDVPMPELMEAIGLWNAGTGC
jgi:hypothetical protein